MKLWQLVSVVGRETLQRIISKERLRFLLVLLDGFDDAVATQDQSVLDFAVPADCVEEVLSGLTTRVFLSADKLRLRSYKMNRQDASLSLCGFSLGWRREVGRSL